MRYKLAATALTLLLAVVISVVVIRHARADTLGGQIEQELRDRGVPVIGVESLSASKVRITYVHGADGWTGPLSPFYNEHVDSVAHSYAGRLSEYELVVRDSSGQVVLDVHVPVTPRSGSGVFKGNPDAIRAALQKVLSQSPGIQNKLKVVAGESGLVAIVDFQVSEADARAEWADTVAKLDATAWSERGNGLSRYELVVKDADGNPVFTAIADYVRRQEGSWSAPGVSNPLANAPPAAN